MSGLGREIATWEAANNVQLPVTYRGFLLAYNGGRIYPGMFQMNMTPEQLGSSETMSMVDPLYDFATAVSLWNGDVYRGGEPKPFFFIGTDPGGMELLMSLRPTDHGAIFLWFGTDLPWGSGGNVETNLHPQAASFSAFIASLTDTADEQGRAHWETPRHKMLARDLILN